MITLKEFDKLKLKGMIEHSRDDYSNAVESFSKALEINNDALTQTYLAGCYYELKNYQEAQRHALEAIKLGHDAYRIFTKATIEKLGDFKTGMKVLDEGIANHSPYACFEKAMLLNLNMVSSNIIPPNDAALCLDLAFEYTPVERKGFAAYLISKAYKKLKELYPSLLDFKYETSEVFYLKVFLDYGGHLLSHQGLNNELFSAFIENDDYSIVSTLLRRFDGDSLLIFALLLFNEEINKTDTVVLKKDNLASLCVFEGARRYKNGGCYALQALYYASDFEGSEYEPKKAKKCIDASFKYQFFLSSSLEPVFKKLMSHAYEEFFNGDYYSMA